ncbi:MAG: hypothetical protein COW13_01720, partial [Candidatus Omnitrophica bacterium CG12_big_fil_rev_8_21_14_0_65_50_5]
NLEAAAAGLQELLNAHGYTDAIVFGHARQGNLHFVFTPDFSREGKVQRYGAFM